MDFPVKLHPSRLAPVYTPSYLWPPAISIILAGLIYAGEPYLGFLPFHTYYLLLVAFLPLLRTVQIEFRRRHREYEFHEDRVIIREGIETVEQQDVLYRDVTDIHSFTSLWEKFFDVGNLEVSVTGREEPFRIIGLKEPQKYEDLILGETGSTDIDEVRGELERLEDQYEKGEIGREEYEQQYYFLKGKMDALEGEG
ncbi:MAG: PH domain-containing protein [Candidatus Nanohaloarchaeota archaeon QJJ-7]|nr:PH domain-containing protein [Candidatus Nanohaloarchaeota archaeon QJJ-7]